MTDLMLNLGCGKITYPGEPHWSHCLIPPDVLRNGEWLNVDRNLTAGVDEQMDLFTYPWPWPDNHFAGALCSHIVEHIPHNPTISPQKVNFTYAGDYWQKYANVMEWAEARGKELDALQDGWFVFFSELHRVLKPGAIAHVLAPHGHSDGALADPTHTRYVLPQTYGYMLEDGQGSAFEYARGSIWRLPTEAIKYRITEMFQHLLPTADDTPEQAAEKTKQLHLAMMTRMNVVYDFYAPLEVVK